MTNISNLLAQWYLDSYEIKLPVIQYTDEARQFSAHWERESMDYSTKILLPVVQQLLSTSQHLPKSDCCVLATSASAHLEDLCVTWGGQFEGNELVNTCPVDYFITLLSLHSHIVSEAFRLSNVSQTHLLQTMFSCIKSRKFDELMIWLASQLGVQQINFRYDFLG